MRLSIGPVWWVLLLMLLLLSRLGSAQCTTQVLSQEFAQDPKSLGYAPLIAAGHDQAVCDTFNLTRSGTDYEVKRGVTASYLIVNEYDPAEYGALTPEKIAQLNGIVNAGQVDMRDDSVRTILGGVFPAGGPTRTNLKAFEKIAGSRSQVLCGQQTTLSDVSKALHP